MHFGRHFTAIFALALSGCVQQAVLENDVRSAQWKARTLATAADTELAFAALSAQLVELEALHQRDPRDVRVLVLLDRGYRLMAHGFIELRHLEALAAADSARADREARLRADAEARARYYRKPLDGGEGAPRLEPLSVQSAFAEAEAACSRHDRADYEQRLNGMLSVTEREPEERLERTLVRRIAGAWLMPNVAARCKF